MCDIVETGAVQAAVGPLWNFSNSDVMHLLLFKLQRCVWTIMQGMSLGYKNLSCGVIECCRMSKVNAQQLSIYLLDCGIFSVHILYSGKFAPPLEWYIN